VKTKSEKTTRQNQIEMLKHYIMDNSPCFYVGESAEDCIRQYCLDRGIKREDYLRKNGLPDEPAALESLLIDNSKSISNREQKRYAELKRRGAEFPRLYFAIKV
jgi:hypothetical protein